jgi:hypothetical protein
MWSTLLELYVYMKIGQILFQKIKKEVTSGFSGELLMIFTNYEGRSSTSQITSRFFTKPRNSRRLHI